MRVLTCLWSGAKVKGPEVAGEGQGPCVQGDRWQEAGRGEGVTGTRGSSHSSPPPALFGKLFPHPNKYIQTNTHLTFIFMVK